MNKNKLNINDVRATVLETAAAPTLDDAKLLAMALIYVGDSIREAAIPTEMIRATEHIGVELGGIAAAINNVGDEIAHLDFNKED